MYNIVYENELYHHGIKGQKWGVRRYQNEDGTLTPEGKKRYAKESARGGSLKPEDWVESDRKNSKTGVTVGIIGGELVRTGAWIASGAGAPAVAAMIANPAIGAVTIGAVGLALAGEVALGRHIADKMIDNKGKRVVKKQDMKKARQLEKDAKYYEKTEKELERDFGIKTHWKEGGSPAELRAQAQSLRKKKYT